MKTEQYKDFLAMWGGRREGHSRRGTRSANVSSGLLPGLHRGECDVGGARGAFSRLSRVGGFANSLHKSSLTGSYLWSIVPPAELAQVKGESEPFA